MCLKYRGHWWTILAISYSIAGSIEIPGNQRAGLSFARQQNWPSPVIKTIKAN
jgi:hypothetical protein